MKKYDLCNKAGYVTFDGLVTCTYLFKLEGSVDIHFVVHYLQTAVVNVSRRQECKRHTIMCCEVYLSTRTNTQAKKFVAIKSMAKFSEHFNFMLISIHADLA